MRSTRAVAPIVWVAVLTIGGWGGACPVLAAETVELPTPSAAPDVQAPLDQADRLRNARDCEAALAASDRALEIARRLGDEAGAALAHRSRALCLVAMHRRDDAVDAWKDAAAAWQRIGHGPGQVEAFAQASQLTCGSCSRDSEALVGRALDRAGQEVERPLAAARALQEAGNAALARDRPDLAHRLLSGAVEIGQRHAPSSILMAESLVGLGRAAMAMDGDVEARAVLLRAREIAEAVDPDGLTVSSTLLELALLAWHQNDFQTSVRYGREAVRIRQRLTPESAGLAASLSALADSETMLGDLDSARRHALQALAIAERLDPGGRALIAPLTTLGIAALWGGDLDAAHAYFDRSVELRRAHGGDPADLACTLLNMGLIPAERSDYAAARRFFTQAVELLDEHAPEHPIRAKALGNLAEITVHLGDAQAAADYARQALPLLEESMPGSISHSMALTRLGQAASLMGDSRTALDYHRRALAIRERVLPDSQFVAESLSFMASELIAQGELRKAERYGRRAFEMVRHLPANTTAAQAATDLGLIERAQGNYTEAEELFEFAASSWSAYAGAEHGALARVYTDLAWLYALQDMPHRAIGAALRSEAIERSHVRDTARSLPEREALQFGWSTCDGVLSLAAAYRDRVPEAPGLVLDAVVRSRAIVLDEVAARHRLTATTSDPEIVRLAGDLDAARERLARLAVRGVAADGAEAYRTALASAMAERRRAEDELAFRSREFQAGQERRSAGLEDVLAGLPEGAALVSYVRYNRSATDAIAITAGSALPSYAAFVARPGASAVVMAPLGEAAEIDRLVADLRGRVDAFAAAPGLAPWRAEHDFRVVGDELRARIWDPVAPHLAGVERVIVVPDGALNLVNLSALPVGESRYLVDTGLRIHHVSAERDLLPRETGPESSGLLAVGSPSFDEPGLFAALRPSSAAPPVRTAALDPGRPTFRGDRSTCAGFRSMRFRPLPSSARETDDILEVWRHASASAVHPGAAAVHDRDPVVLTGPAADESSFKVMAADRRVLHLATHGFFLGRQCPPGPDPASPGSRGADQLPDGDNALLLAGLALAGANQRDAAGPDEDDGILTAEEIAGLDLGAVGWAVLSACDTGVGEVSAGEGVFGLRRAFQVAGVRTLIMSLWKVEDEASRAWMRHLYENRLIEGLSTIESVHAATLAVLSERRSAGLGTHPFYWAGFIASGDWR